MKRFFFIAVSLLIGIGAIAQNIDYGLEEANHKFVLREGGLGGRTDFDYLALKNHPAVSGVPLGGIGAGNVNFAPDGSFTRIGYSP